jgi:hypothetical protein
VKVILRTNEDDWRELEYKTGGEVVVEHAGHDVPEFIWLDVLRAIGVEVEVVYDDFGV